MQAARSLPPTLGPGALASSMFGGFVGAQLPGHLRFRLGWREVPRWEGSGHGVKHFSSLCSGQKANLSGECR